jgi:hypothetical protein
MRSIPSISGLHLANGSFKPNMVPVFLLMDRADDGLFSVQETRDRDVLQLEPKGWVQG